MCLAADRLDAIFEENAEQQYSGDLLFSTVADIMGLVVCQIHPSVNAAYIDRKEEIGVTIKSVYDKLKGIEPGVSRALVRDTAARMQAIIKQARRNLRAAGGRISHQDRRWKPLASDRPTDW